ncbi:MAG: 30S ribosome-binding factor RbfA [Actinobacteria bacterium]|nr:30S ribosome-binding factor RbfA [Actinomycetota bacterium]
MSERTQKVAENIREKVSEIIQREIKDPRVGFVTVTGAEVTPDLREAKIFVTVLGDVKRRREAIEGLTSAAGFIRGELGKHMRTKYTPHLTFLYDESVDKGMRIERLISKVSKKEAAE